MMSCLSNTDAEIRSCNIEYVEILSHARVYQDTWLTMNKTLENSPWRL